MGTPGTSGGGSFDELDLPGPGFYPESIASAADGTLYVGSFGTPTIVKFAAGSNTAVKFVTQLSAGKNINGVLVDETDKSLLACVNDSTALGTFKPLVKRFNLSDGSEKASYEFLAPGVCNDLGFDGKHNLYVTDSFGKIYKLADGAQALTQWSADATLAPVAQGTFGADGIAWDGQSNLYVNHFALGSLLRIPIDAATGNAGTVVKINVTPALSSPDGMRAVDANTLLVIEGTGPMANAGAGRLTRLTLSGNAAMGIALSNRLDYPTGLAKVGTDYWVSEGQLGHLFGALPGPPNLPFLVRRVPTF